MEGDDLALCMNFMVRRPEEKLFGFGVGVDAMLVDVSASTVQLLGRQFRSATM